MSARPLRMVSSSSLHQMPKMSLIHLMTWLLLTIGSLLLGVSAQTTTTKASSAATSTSSSTGIATHTIQVGPRSDPHQYVPSSVNASVGDVIVFEFYPRNHSVVKADYDAPCLPAQTGALFYSGHFEKFNEENGQLIGPPPTWSLVVNDTKPTFFYCTAIGSCNKNGMVGVINPTENMTWKHQHDKALKSPYQLEPWEHVPAEGETPGSTSTSTPSAGSSSGSHLSPGAIAGIVIGGVAFVGLLVALFFVMGRNQVYKKWMTSQDGTTERTARWALFNSHGGDRKSDWDNTQPPGDQPTYMPSPDPTQRTFSSPPGQYGWDQSMFQPMPQSPPLRNMAPTELEAPEPVNPYRGDGR
ncbi:hypothetical protein BDV23DRAFT_81467 [Aspergillus alliaceus]|uniref:Cupredoxin n=1 Tax=Petromyces alliaceus TaxID=209559 RepID=A0A5N7CNG7_PETAA|nr:hypothetical protein BDV23DRAFT_81467 [Aspergillus alliaceus]